MEPLFPELDTPAFTGLKARLDMLGSMPPQVLLLDGGSEPQRLAAARYWACRCNCPGARELGRPCLECETCSLIARQEHLDVPAYDGRISNKQDEEAPGPIRALSIKNVRELKGLLKDPPHGAGLRVVLLMGLERNRSESANALLKALEEPSQTTVFVLLAAQREQLLPTLVSRSHCLILPWPDPEAEEESAARGELASDVQEFLRTGRRLMSRTSQKSFDAAQAQLIISILQKSLMRVMAGRAGEEGVDSLLVLLPPLHQVNVSRWLNDAQGKIAGQITPGRVIDALMTRIYLLVAEASGRQV